MSEMKSTQNLYPDSGEILEGKYEIQQVLGTGAMGSVVRAYHQLRKAPVALKFMSPAIMDKRDVVERFLNEGVAASKIDSEHVVKVYDVSKLPSGVPYMVMEFLEGEDLCELLEREGKPYLDDVQRAVHITLQILRGLQVAHRAKIVHRDMKPANCFVTGKDGDKDFIKIVDFGISKLRQDGADEGVALTHAGAALGTPLYMSLEQARSPKDVDARTDVYSTAVILYELLTGTTPFVPASGTLSELFTMLAIEDPEPIGEYRDDLPEGLWEVVQKGLEKDLDKRWPSARAFAEALLPYGDERSEYIAAKVLRMTAAGARSRYPGPLTGRPPALRGTGSGTLMMQPADSSRGLVPTLDDSDLQKVPASAETLEQGPAGMRRVMGAETARGTMRETAAIPYEPGRNTAAVVAVAVVVMGLMGALSFAMWKLGTTEKLPAAVEPDPANTAVPTATSTAQPQPTASPTVVPTDSASVSPEPRTVPSQPTNVVSPTQTPSVTTGPNPVPHVRPKEVSDITPD